ncbi:MAG: hypothetical protein AB9834_16115 [Lentimicrobium sp.]
MNRSGTFLGMFLFSVSGLFAQTADTLLFSGQASAWANANFSEDASIWTGARYLPQLNYTLERPLGKFDFEGSLNAYGNLGFRPYDSPVVEGKIKPYRFWMRYSSNQLELRLGLQKINFGSAAFIRPLMWFDQVDPRDPLQLTDGVWGLLGRYYFLNNANIWLWVLYPSSDPKTWEFAGSNMHFPEIGGRIQTPVPAGEIGLSYHYRKADTRGNSLEIPEIEELPENRIGLDGKWDVGVGLWFEATQTSFAEPVNELTHQTMLAIGTDYTFNAGNGLNVIFEHLVAASGEKAFQYAGALNFSGISVTYPLSMFTQLNAIFYYDWGNGNAYNYLSFKRQLKIMDLHLMAYWNPENTLMPNQPSEYNLYAGAGIQCMLVFNH